MTLNSRPKDNTTDGVHYSVGGASEVLGISKTMIRKWINNKDNPLTHLKPTPRKTTVLLEDVIEYMEELNKKLSK